VANEGDEKAEGTGGSFTPEMVSEMLKSPQFAQLVTQVLTNMKQPAEASSETAEPEQQPTRQVPRQGMFFGPPGWGPWGYKKEEGDAQ
jgi:hypothetical protein